jgi:cytolysin-activating lysine-acyltransferase
MGRIGMDATAAFGAAVWLAMQAPKVKDLLLHQLNQLVLQPQAAGCEVLISSPDAEGKWRPRLWLAYAYLSAEFEREYVLDPSMPLPPQAWHSGDRLWLLHVIAPNGFEQELRRTLRELFAAHSARSLSPHSRWSGQRLVVWRGFGCSRTDTIEFWRQRPILA